jgi:NADPH-dependent curcumin reductase CurA
MATYNTVVLAERPTGDIVPGKTFKMKEEKKPSEAELKEGQVLLETRYLSLDPAMRGCLNGLFIPHSSHTVTSSGKTNTQNFHGIIS